MKTVFLFVWMAALALRSSAQEHWTVVLNNKPLLTAKTEDTANNIATINDIKKGALVVTYVPAKPQPGWGRRIAVYDATDNELYSKETMTLVVPAKSLKQWHRNNSKQIKIYTWAVPKDPDQAIKVRVRRVHLCTINLHD